MYLKWPILKFYLQLTILQVTLLNHQDVKMVSIYKSYNTTLYGF